MFFELFFLPITNEHLAGVTTVMVSSCQFHRCSLTKIKQQRKEKERKKKTAHLTVHHIKALGCILIYPMHAAICDRISE